MKPVCWYHPFSGRIRFDGEALGPKWIPLYKRTEWQSLNEEEFYQILEQAEGAIGLFHLIDQKLKEKNHDQA